MGAEAFRNYLVIGARAAISEISRMTDMSEFPMDSYAVYTRSNRSCELC
jgi:hypothetical protein